MKVILSTLAVAMLAGALFVQPAEARCWWNGYQWHCWHPHHSWYWHHHHRHDWHPYN